jgi:hypothetical protein
MKSLDYRLEVFPSAAAFLKSPRLAKTTVVIGDVPGPNSIARTVTAAKRGRWEAAPAVG